MTALHDIDKTLIPGTILVTTDQQTSGGMARSVILLLDRCDGILTAVEIAGRPVMPGIHAGGTVMGEEPGLIVLHGAKTGLLSSPLIGDSGFAHTWLFTEKSVQEKLPGFLEIDSRKRLLLTGYMALNPQELAGEVQDVLWRSVDPVLHETLGLLLAQEWDKRWEVAAKIAGDPPAPAAQEPAKPVRRHIISR